MIKRNAEELADALAGITDKELMAQFLRELLTSSEIETIGLRWELVKRLEQGIPQRQIAKELGISLCKITRGSKELKKPGSALKKVIRKYASQEKEE